MESSLYYHDNKILVPPFQCQVSQKSDMIMFDSYWLDIFDKAIVKTHSYLGFWGLYFINGLKIYPDIKKEKYYINRI